MLTFLGDLLADGTILLFDDWNCFGGDDERGQRKAFAEFLEWNPHLSAEAIFAYGLYGQVFTVRTGGPRAGNGASSVEDGGGAPLPRGE